MTHRAIVIFLPALFLFSLCAAADGQFVFATPTPTPTPKPSPPPPAARPCPNISVNAQSSRFVRDGDHVFFQVNINGGDPRAVPTILWSTSAGFIAQGQNTRRIDVDTTGAGATPDRQLKAEVWIGGYAPECVLQASGSVNIIPPAVKFGDFGVVDDATLTRNADTLAKYLEPSTDSLFIIAYSGRASERNFAFTWLNRIRDALVTAGVSARRIRTVDGGYREEPLFDFWIVPRGATPPAAEPTIKRSDIIRSAPANRRPE